MGGDAWHVPVSRRGDAPPQPPSTYFLHYSSHITSTPPIIPLHSLRRRGTRMHIEVVGRREGHHQPAGHLEVMRQLQVVIITYLQSHPYPPPPPSSPSVGLGTWPSCSSSRVILTWCCRTLGFYIYIDRGVTSSHMHLPQTTHCLPSLLAAGRHHRSTHSSLPLP